MVATGFCGTMQAATLSQHLNTELLWLIVNLVGNINVELKICKGLHKLARMESYQVCQTVNYSYDLAVTNFWEPIDGMFLVEVWCNNWCLIHLLEWKERKKSISNMRALDRGI